METGCLSAFRKIIMIVIYFIFNIFPWLLIFGWFLYANKLIFSNRVEGIFVRHTVDTIPNVFVTLGLFGTFMGITYGLLQFDTDPNRIKNSIRMLLDGLKTAMFTSIGGIFLSLIYSRIIEIKIPVTESDETKELRRLNNKFDLMTDSILEAHQKALIKAFKDVLLNFNDIFKDILEDMVTSNFNELSNTVETLTEWQKSHKQDVEALKSAYSSLVKEHKTFADTTAIWVSRLDEIAGQSSRLQGIIDSFNKSFNEDGNLSRILDGITQAILELRTSTEHIQNVINNASSISQDVVFVSSMVGGWKEHLGSISDQLGSVVDRVSTLRSIDTESVQRMLNSIDRLFETYISDLEDRINRSKGKEIE